MAWTAPMTAAANATFNAADWNTHIRDNLLETEAGKGTTAGSYFVSTAANAITQRATTSAVVTTQESTTSTSYADLATAGPAVTATTGTAAIVWIQAGMNQTSTNAAMSVSFAVSGATVVSASDVWRVLTDGVADNPDMGGNPRDNHNRRGICRYVSGLTAGSNTFTMKYRVSSGTGHFHNREIVVMPL